MRFSIRPSDPRAIYVQIMDEVRRAIVVGALRPGDSLPSVRQLAADVRVNPNTVAQAYRELERAGVVYVRRGQGTFVAASDGGEEARKALIRDFAERALADARRQGISAGELLEAIREVSASPSIPSTPSSA